MTDKTGKYPGFLHLEDGAHRSTPSAAAPADPGLFEALSRRHREDHHHDEVLDIYARLADVLNELAAAGQTLRGTDIDLKPLLDLYIIQSDNGSVVRHDGAWTVPEYARKRTS